MRSMLGVRYPIMPLEKTLKFDCPMSSPQMIRMLGFFSPPVGFALFAAFVPFAIVVSLLAAVSIRRGQLPAALKCLPRSNACRAQNGSECKLRILSPAGRPREK